MNDKDLNRIPFSDDDQSVNGDFPDFDKSKPLRDFLPSPQELFLESGISAKITIQVEEKTVEAFRRMADQNGVKYQKLIREVLKRYAQQYDKRT